jgi:fructose-1-phosphate kinase PfkB-like protein
VAAFARTAAPTRICQTLLCSATGTATELVEEAAWPPDADWAALLAVYDRLLATAGFVAISGNLPRAASEDTYAELVARAAGRAVPVLIDSSGSPLLRCLRHRPAVVKLNVHELPLTLGTHDMGDALLPGARYLLSEGAGCAVVTDGPRAVWLIGPEQVLRFRPPAVRAVNPIGSGDAVSAGIVHRLLCGDSLPNAVRFGVACGTANALALGQGEFTLDDALHIEQQVEVHS